MKGNHVQRLLKICPCQQCLFIGFSSIKYVLKRGSTFVNHSWKRSSHEFLNTKQKWWLSCSATTSGMSWSIHPSLQIWLPVTFGCSKIWKRTSGDNDLNQQKTLFLQQMRLLNSWTNRCLQLLLTAGYTEWRSSSTMAVATLSRADNKVNLYQIPISYHV